MVLNLFYQMRIKLLAVSAGLVSISYDSGQIVLRYPQLVNGSEKSGLGRNQDHLKDIGPGIRSGKNAYWMAIGKDLDWQEKLLSILMALGNKD
jgi:hypothetical protein